MKFCCADKKLFFIGWLCISQKSRSFSQPKHCLFEQAILLSSNDANFRNRHRKFAPSHNLLSAKNTAVLLQSALNPHAVTPEPRTDSKPFRRRFVRKTGFGSCCRKLFQNYFRQSFESRSQDGVPCAFYVTFCTMQKVTSRSLCREPRGFANLEAARRNDGEL